MWLLPLLLVGDDQDVRGRTVVDQNGQAFGTVDSMLLNTELITTLVLEDGTEVPVKDVTLAGDVVRYDRSGLAVAPDRTGSAREGALVLDDGASRHEPHAVGSGSTGVAGTADDEAHFASTYGQSGRTSAQMQPAYDCGRTARSTYGDRDFASAEATMRQEYEGRYGSDGDNAWDTVKDAIRHGYDRAKRAVP